MRRFGPPGWRPGNGSESPGGCLALLSWLKPQWTGPAVGASHSAAAALGVRRSGWSESGPAVIVSRFAQPMVPSTFSGRCANLGRWTDSRNPTRQRNMPQLEVRGVHLYYEEHAKGSRSSSSTAFRPRHRSGARRSTNSPAWGESSSTTVAAARAASGRARTRRRTSAEHADDAAELLLSLAATPAVVIGRSYGREVALDLRSATRNAVARSFFWKLLP